MAEKLKKNKRISDKVVEFAKAGRGKVECFEYCKATYSAAPNSYKVFLKLYNVDWNEAIGVDTSIAKSKLMLNVEQGDQKAIEYYLDRRGGWAKKTAEDNVGASEEEETEGHMKALLTALGKDED